MGRFLRISMFLPLFLLIACGDGSAPPAPPPPDVGVVTIAPEAMDITTELPGRTSAFRVAEVRPQVNGIIVKRLFTEGSDVKEGDQLYQIDPAPYQAALDSATADLAKAKANVQSAQARAGRYASLVKIDAVSRQDYDDAMATLSQNKAQVAAAEAALTTAQINLNYTRVFSPISGRIGKSLVTEGALVTANQSTPLTSVTQLDPIFVDMTQSSAEMMRLRRVVGANAQQGGGNVRLTIEGDGQPYPEIGHLQFSDVTVDQATGSVQLRALFPNSNNLLLPGLFVRATITQGVEKNAVLVPQQALIRQPDGRTVVWVVSPAEGGGLVANMQPVTVVRAVGNRWLLAPNGGLSGGEQVVVQGLQKLMRPGTPVRATALASADGKESAPAAAGGKP